MTKVLHPKDIRNRLYHIIGFIAVCFNYFRHMLLGYRTPRTFPITQYDKAIDYDFKIVNRWLDHIRKYTGESDPFKGKVVLELGAGADLGAGLLLLAKGTKKYIALDIHNLAESVPNEFYDKLIERMREKSEYDADFAREQLAKFQRGEESKLCYVVNKEFNVSTIQEKIDVVISNVAFEHFDDIGETIKGLSSITNKRGILYSHVDMNTHTRWIKDRDPLNIYRFSDLFWKLFKFKGSPNRLRIPQYKSVMEMNAWENIVIEPRTILKGQYADKIIHTLNKRFREYGTSEMRVLSFILLATKE